MRRIVSLLPRQDWIVVGWVMAITIVLFLIGVKSYPMFGDRYEPSHNNGFRYGTSGTSGITRKSQNLVTAERTAPSPFIHCFHGRSVWLLLSAEVILLRPSSSLVSLPLSQRSCCEDLFSLITRPVSRCGAYGSFSFFRRHIFFILDIVKAYFSLWRWLPSWPHASSDGGWQDCWERFVG